LALVTGLYLWLRRSNAILPDVTPPRALRRWTAAFFVMVALSHVWWYVLGVYWLTDDRMVRNITAVTLDHILLVPLVMAILLRMLQNHEYRLWPWVLTQMPILVSAAVGIATHDAFYGFDLPTYWQVAVMVIFVLYYIYVLIHYGRWLRENYADLEHEAILQAAETIISWGLQPVLGPHTNNLNVNAYAGTADERAADLMWALEDESIKAIVCSRGGYGTIHLLNASQTHKGNVQFDVTGHFLGMTQMSAYLNLQIPFFFIIFAPNQLPS